MKLTIFIGEYEGSLNANTRIAISIIKEFIKKGHECDCLAISFYSEEYFEITIEDVNVKIFPVNGRIGLFRDKKDKSGQGLPKYSIHHPLQFIYYLINRSSDYKEIVSYIGRKDQSAEDCIIGLIMPFSATKEIVMNVQRMKTIVYQLDPWGLNNFLYVEQKNKKIKDELQVFEKVGHIFTTDLLYREYFTNASYGKYIEKMSIAQFPNLAKKKETECRSCVFKEDDYNIVFLGTVNDSYRNPSEILGFLLHIKDRYLPYIKVFFIGNNESAELSEIKTNNPETILIHEPVDTYQANYLMKQNVYLLNINNNLSNQSPSKLIDYISTGNPIINVVSRKDDVSLKILEKYKYKFNYFENNINDEKSFVEFLKENKNQKMSFDKLLELYCEYTPEFVAKMILTKAEELTSQR